MSLITEMRTHLLGDAAIASAVGARIRAGHMDQDETMPAIRLAIVSGNSDDTLAGESALAHAVLQVDAYHDKRIDADALAELVRLRMRGIRGSYGAIFVNGCSVASGPRMIDEPINDGGNEWRAVTGRDFRISHTQPTI